MDELEKYVLDVTLDDVLSFVPVTNDGSILIGMTFIADECPGELLGVYHEEGFEKAKEWANKHPDWYERYSRKKQDQGD